MALALLAREEMIGIGRLEGRKRGRCAPLAKAMRVSPGDAEGSFFNATLKDLTSSAYEVNFIDLRS